jgi:hypothetical protein
VIDARQILRLGPPLRLTAEELDRMAEVTSADTLLARLLWQQAAPAVLRDLLDGRSMERP